MDVHINLGQLLGAGTAGGPNLAQDIEVAERVLQLQRLLRYIQRGLDELERGRNGDGQSSNSSSGSNSPPEPISLLVSSSIPAPGHQHHHHQNVMDPVLASRAAAAAAEAAAQMAQHAAASVAVSRNLFEFKTITAYFAQY